MLATCLINSYNYRPYVAEAVESALAQTRPFDQILVIDDGSTDGSQQLLTERFGSNARVQIIRKNNGGQLSAFNHGLPHVRGDFLFFLDADDRYRPTYLERALACYEWTGADFLVTGFENFGPQASKPAKAVGDCDLGFSVLTAIFAGTWVGGPTSTLSMRTTLARDILPYPHEAEWRIRADNVLVYGASVLGAHKYRLGGLHIDRRVHGANLYFGQEIDRLSSMRNALVLNRLFAWYTAKAGYNVADLPRLLTREFRTLEQPTLKEYRRYLRMAWTTRQSLFLRAKQTLSLTAHMLHRTNKRQMSIGTDVPAQSSQRRAA
jgi:glycosyltransferase involved in cell wall biosynthesis